MNHTALSSLSEHEIREWLLTHPEFLQHYPEVLLTLVPPAEQHGGNVLDFQHYMLSHLQDHLRQLKDRFDVLIHSSRDNMSAQAQVHRAVVDIIKARSLEGLLQTLTQDLVPMFDVDMVRLALESPAAEYTQSTSRMAPLTEQGEARSVGFGAALAPTYNDASFIFIEPGTVDALLGKGHSIRLIADIATETSPDLQQLFTDCEGLVQSCALIRMALPDTNHQALLVFAVRHAGRFHPQQGVDLLQFLAQVVEHTLDRCLLREGVELN